MEERTAVKLRLFVVLAAAAYFFFLTYFGKVTITYMSVVIDEYHYVRRIVWYVILFLVLFGILSFAVKIASLIYLSTTSFKPTRSITGEILILISLPMNYWICMLVRLIWDDIYNYEGMKDMFDVFGFLTPMHMRMAVTWGMATIAFLTVAVVISIYRKRILPGCIVTEYGLTSDYSLKKGVRILATIGVVLSVIYYFILTLIYLFYGLLNLKPGQDDELFFAMFAWIVVSVIIVAVRLLFMFKLFFSKVDWKRHIVFEKMSMIALCLTPIGHLAAFRGCKLIFNDCWLCKVFNGKMNIMIWTIPLVDSLDVGAIICLIAAFTILIIRKRTGDEDYAEMVEYSDDVYQGDSEAGDNLDYVTESFRK